ncbi:hypothetical protein AB4Z17_09425 [Paenibacillus sp. TAF43_2]|uniref:hypothetical protein n=1 Tax=Paenibacillus sp. TAF43_2 TaxID=3233069 RepID=UPI003F99D25B
MDSFGKRIYYDITSGSVILVTNEMQGEGIQQLTPTQEREVYNILSERLEASYNFIQLEYGDRKQDFMDGHPTAVNVTTNEIVWTLYDPAAVEERKTLEQEIAELKLEKEKMKADNLMLMEAVFDLYAMVAVQQGA